jgi:hypothetical protein
MKGFTIEEVRGIAELNEYAELSLNKTSRVLSFCNQSGSVRINVYYTTGTVGTCLSHPQKGKTQLFRREVDVELLNLIFRNPRGHTGKGYHRKNARQWWKSANHGLEPDSARRWRFVASVSGLSTDSKEIDNISKFCSLWDDLYWDKGDLPDLSKTNFACGSRASLISMAMDVAQELLRNTLCICNRKHAEAFQRGRLEESDIETYPCGNCCNMEHFLKVHSADVTRLKKKLRRFRGAVCVEVIRWLIARDICGTSLFDESYTPITTAYSDIVDSAHQDYGELVYSKEDNLCPCHGVIYN